MAKRTFDLKSNLKLDEILTWVDPLREPIKTGRGTICDPTEVGGTCLNHKPCFYYRVTVEKIPAPKH